MKHQEELMKAEEKKNAAKDEANTKLMEAIKSGNKAAQKAAEERLAAAKRLEEQSKDASKKQIEASKAATEQAIKAQNEAREREKQMEESKKDLEKDLKQQGEKATSLRIELARSQARAEAAEKAASQDPKCCDADENPDKVHELELKLSNLEGRLSERPQCGADQPCNLPAENKNNEGAIQTAVDAAVAKLINKTRERKAQEDAIESVEEKNEEREEVLKAERDSIVNEKLELEKEKEEAESRAKEEDADLVLMKAQHQKTKLENGKLKSDILNLQQTLTKMGEEKMELNNRLNDLATPAS